MNFFHQVTKQVVMEELHMTQFLESKMFVENSAIMKVIVMNQSMTSRSKSHIDGCAIGKTFHCTFKKMSERKGIV